MDIFATSSRYKFYFSRVTHRFVINFVAKMRGSAVTELFVRRAR